LRLPDGTQIQELASGFEVVPYLAGGGVALEIAQQRETPDRVPGPYKGNAWPRRSTPASASGSRSGVPPLPLTAMTAPSVRQAAGARASRAACGSRWRRST